MSIHSIELRLHSFFIDVGQPQMSQPPCGARRTPRQSKPKLFQPIADCDEQNQFFLSLSQPATIQTKTFSARRGLRRVEPELFQPVAGCDTPNQNFFSPSRIATEPTELNRPHRGTPPRTPVARTHAVAKASKPGPWFSRKKRFTPTFCHKIMGRPQY